MFRVYLPFPRINVRGLENSVINITIRSIFPRIWIEYTSCSFQELVAASSSDFLGRCLVEFGLYACIDFFSQQMFICDTLIYCERMWTILFNNDNYNDSDNDNDIDILILILILIFL